MEGDIMRMAKSDIPVRIAAPGATARQQTDIVMFSPQKEHGAVIEHIRARVDG